MPASRSTSLTRAQWVIPRCDAKSQSKKSMMEALVLGAIQAASKHLLVVRILRLLRLEEMHGLLVPLMSGVPRLQRWRLVEEVKTAGRVLLCAFIYGLTVHFNSDLEG